MLRINIHDEGKSTWFTKEIVSAGGSAEASEVDALDEQALDKHLQSMIDKAGRVDISQSQEMLASTTHARRLMTLEEMANVAVFVASDKATGMTGTTVNLSMGTLDD
jgi:NAD(P)-dependent dehydrogenase (short-subunit alcohol dehydrogenase family)